MLKSGYNVCLSVCACVRVFVCTERGTGTRRGGGGGGTERGTVTAKERKLRASGRAVEVQGDVAEAGVYISYIRYTLCVLWNVYAACCIGYVLCINITC
jgi:hypothetical protein